MVSGIAEMPWQGPMNQLDQCAGVGVLKRATARSQRYSRTAVELERLAHILMVE